jgi:hypothetical protein
MEPLSLKLLNTKWKELDDTKFLILFNAVLIHAGTFMAANLALFNHNMQDKMSDVAMKKLVDVTVIVQAFSDEADKRGIYSVDGYLDRPTPMTTASKKTLH